MNGSSIMSNCFQITLVIGLFVTFGGFPSRFSKCCFNSFILSCWFVAFNFALVELFLLHPLETQWRDRQSRIAW